MMAAIIIVTVRCWDGGRFGTIGHHGIHSTRWNRNGCNIVIQHTSCCCCWIIMRGGGGGRGGSLGYLGIHFRRCPGYYANKKRERERWGNDDDDDDDEMRIYVCICNTPSGFVG